MSAYCECGDVATIYMDANGDPLPEPLCSECWFYQLTMHEMHLPEQVFDIDANDLFPRQPPISRGPGALGPRRGGVGGCASPHKKETTKEVAYD